MEEPESEEEEDESEEEESDEDAEEKEAVKEGISPEAKAGEDDGVDAGADDGRKPIDDKETDEWVLAGGLGACLQRENGADGSLADALAKVSV